MDELKRRLEVLLGARSDAPMDESERQARESEAAHVARQRERIAEAGGELVGAAFRFLGEVLPASPDSPHAHELGDRIHEQLSRCLESDPSGRPRLTVTLPDPAALEGLARSLGQLLARAAPPAAP
jgi:hypothetical protein